MEKEAYQKAREYWLKKDLTSVKMEREALLKEIEKYLSENNTCALATGEGTYIRCTPLEYTYYQGAFYFFTEGGKKFIGLEKNENVSIAVFDKYQGFGSLKGLQIQGKGTLIVPFSKEYIQILEYKKLPVESLRKLKNPLYLLKVIPSSFDFLNSDFKKAGFGERQHLEMKG